METTPIAARAALFSWLLPWVLAWSAPQAAAQGDSAVEVRKLADQAYELVLKSRRSQDVGQGQKELQPTAQRLCGALPVNFGRYQFEKSEPLSAPTGPGRFVLKQEIQCGGSAAAAALAPTPAASGAGPQPPWAPSQADQAQVTLLTQRYFSLKDSGDFKAAYALLAPEMQQGASLERWTVQRADFSGRAGEVKNRTVRKITWYKDPPNAQARGVFAAVDHAGSFQNIGIHCGYLMWHQQPDGSFKLFGEVENSIDRKTEAKMGAEQVAAARKAFRC